MEAWYERLKRRRKDLGLTQADVHRAIGVSNYTVSSWESGKHKPEGENLLKLCRALDCDPEWLLSGKEAKTWLDHDHAAQGGAVGPEQPLPFDPEALTSSQKKLWQSMLESLPRMDDQMAEAIRTLVSSSQKGGKTTR